ncbi:MAG: 3-deoxy-D-manno-octulosonate 8-phosphate phosphatase [Myxococcales bacterium]|nr:3-deoxy-D-manno-octulosonate 8-phosphate phosphatase [Myxococcales bacterium]
MKTPPFHITRAQVAARASRVRLVLVDNDGTLTDGQCYYTARGEEMKVYSLRDGIGVQLLREAGVETAIVSREASEIAARRAETLKLPYTFLGVENKLEHLAQIEATTGFKRDVMAYMGDDVGDLEIMRALSAVSLVGTPADGHGLLRDHAHFISDKPGGHGAFRAFAEWLLAWRA